MPVKIETDFKAPSDTHTVLVLVPNYWGRGATKAEAMKIVKREGGTPSKTGYVAYYFGPDFGDEPFVDQMGSVCWQYASEEVAATSLRPQPVVEQRIAPSYRAR